MKRLTPAVIFEIKCNRAGKWFYHLLAGGKILSRSAPYFSKWNAKRAVKRLVSLTPNSKWRFYRLPLTVVQDGDFH